MKLNQLSFSIGADELDGALQAALQARGGALPEGLEKPHVGIKDGHLVISVQKKMGFMPITFSLSLGLRPTEDGQGITITIAKVNAGFIGSEAIAGQLVSAIAQNLQNVPGCTIQGNDITFTKAAIAAKVPMLLLPGAVRTCAVTRDSLEFTLN